jgi:DNA-3-methyladenine glycosylase
VKVGIKRSRGRDLRPVDERLRRAEEPEPGRDAPYLKPLPRSFFEPSAEVVAPVLLGHWLIHRTEDGPVGGVIVEVEAYLEKDPACHAFKGESARNRTMFGPPGHSYVYLIYGFHFCVNTVCRPKGIAEGVLIRAVHPRWGLDAIRKRRGDVAERHLTSGPGKVCAAMGITRELDGADICQAASLLLVAENTEKAETLKELGPVVQTTRIGISKAADWPLRWYLGGSGYVSKR